MNPIIQKVLVCSFLATLFSTAGLGAYTANYTVGDMDDIVIDLTGTVLVEVKGDVPTLVDLGVLYLIMILLTMIVGAIIALFLIVPKMMKRKKSVV